MNMATGKVQRRGLTGFWQGRRVCVAGGAGFLGSRISDRLRAAGAQVESVSRRSGTDLRNGADAIKALSSLKPEVLINCAADQGGIEYQRQKPATIMVNNLLIGINLMEAARAAQVAKYVDIVAACAYPGYQDHGLLTESAFWDGPLHDSVLNYGITKKVQTVQGLMYRRQYGFRSIHLIMTNLYGPGDHFHPTRSHALAALIRKFYEARRDGSPQVVVWGTGRPVREWMFVDDAATLVLRAAEVYDAVEPLNIGTGVGITISELAETVGRMVEFHGQIAYDTSKGDGAMRKVMDTSKMKGALGELSLTPLELGISRTVAWFSENYEKVASGI